ncbi:MAG: outer membrane lipoprotein carrier protein LolA [Firmicutes bacterium]|nr:outer membrane lipoprotein carrier protein LolA [Bacillota bacterium]
MKRCIKKITKSIIGATVIFILTGCSENNEKFKDVNDMISGLENYSAKMNITYISNKGEITYEGEQGASVDGRYRITTTKPEEVESCVIINDGKMIWQYNPRVSSTFSVKANDKKERYELIIFSFIKNYRNSENVKEETEDGKYTVLEANIEGGGKYISSEKLWIENENFTPVKLIIYDDEGKERIREEFSGFDTKPAFEEGYFLPQNKEGEEKEDA